MTAAASDARFMHRALELARRGAGQVAPNPLVGAVIVRDGHVVGEGWHARYGEPHAEVMALRAAGKQARGATAFVTLEPCHHHGQTPPCTGALHAAGIVQVVYAIPDPNPIAAGGAQWLASHGVSVQTGLLATEAADLNAAFLFAARGAQRPFVTVKLAVSIDGAIVGASRRRGWLTGASARTAVHHLRAEADAIAVGIGTVLADDPALTVRDVPTPRVTPLRVVFDRHARLPLSSRLVQTASAAPVLVLSDGSDPVAERSLTLAGVQVQAAASLRSSMRLLRARGVRHLFVEGGATLASSLLDAGLVDRLITFQAPVILGAGAVPAFGALPARDADTAPRLRVIARHAYDADLMTTYAVAGE